jgi:hypothetical protein
VATLVWYRSKHARKMKAQRGSNAEAPPIRIVVAVAPEPSTLIRSRWR